GATLWFLRRATNEAAQVQANTYAVWGRARLSNLQGCKDVKRRRGERSCEIPGGRRAPSDKPEVRSLGFTSQDHLVLMSVFFLWWPVRRQVFVVIRQRIKRNRQEIGNGSPRKISLGRNQDRDEKTGEPIHRQGLPNGLKPQLVNRIYTGALHS